MMSVTMSVTGWIRRVARERGADMRASEDFVREFAREAPAAVVPFLAVAAIMGVIVSALLAVL
jgi:hypothetical protein